VSIEDSTLCDQSAAVLTSVLMTIFNGMIVAGCTDADVIDFCRHALVQTHVIRNELGANAGAPMIPTVPRVKGHD
jgi:hypothetical protein